MTARGADVGIVTGLADEAACLASKAGGVRIVCAGADAARAGALAEDLADGGCVALVSFGLAGGLDPAVASGTLLLPAAVIAPDGRAHPTDPGWRERLLALIGSIGTGAGAAEIAGVDAPLAEPTDKAALFGRTGAAGVDMESHAVAAVAQRRSIPLLVVRAVADPAGQRIPAWLDGIIAADGNPRVTALLAALATHPADLATLLRLAAGARRGLAALRGVAALGGSRLGFDA